MKILNLVKQNIGKMDVRKAHIEKAHITNYRISKFLNERGGLDCFELTRLLLAMGFKIVDKSGNTVLGQPELVQQQINDNILLPIEEPTNEGE